MSASNELRVGIVQCALSDDRHENISRVVKLVRDAAKQGAQVIALPELFEGHYFCKLEHHDQFARARATDEDEAIKALTPLAKELNVVLPVSFFERNGQSYYNSVAVIDADGTNLGVYRKSHIPDGPGYEEKYYFRPGDTGFQVWKTKHATIGVGICWDQWFPECARAMTLLGAEVLLYPTAIGSEPADADQDTKDPWQRVMIGHAVANAIPVAASNRIGDEDGQHFYGHSFICNVRGDKVEEIPRGESGVRVATFDRTAVQRYRDAFGFFRDRRPDLYGALTEGAKRS